MVMAGAAKAVAQTAATKAVATAQTLEGCSVEKEAELASQAAPAMSEAAATAREAAAMATVLEAVKEEAAAAGGTVQALAEHGSESARGRSARTQARQDRR